MSPILKFTSSELSVDSAVNLTLSSYYSLLLGKLFIGCYPELKSLVIGRLPGFDVVYKDVKKMRRGLL